MRATTPAAVHPDIVLVAIDDSTLRRLDPIFGRWPWPRLVHSYAIDFLARGPARVVAYDVLFTEHDRRRFELNGEEWKGEESDAELARSAAAAGNVIFVGDAVPEPTERSAASSAPLPVPSGYRLDDSIEARPIYTPPIEPVARASRALAHNFFVLDPDGPVRRSVPFIRTGGAWLPSLGTAAAAIALGIAPNQVRVDAGGLRMGDRFLPLVDATIPSYYGERHRSRRALIPYKGGVVENGAPLYPEYSFGDLVYSEFQLSDGKPPSIDPAVFRNKVVFVGATASSLFDVFTVPLAGKMPGAQVHAAVADGLLSRRSMQPARWRTTAVVTVAAGVALGFAGVLLGPWIATALALGGAAVLVGGLTAVFAQGTWVEMTAPLIAVALATFGGVTYQYVVEGREKRRVKQIFSRYVSRDVYEQLLHDPALARLGGHRRRMSVLFSDIRGFTSVSERGEPEVIVGQLNEYFSRMVPIVFAHRGTVDKFVGDLIMALFGAPLEDEQHAEHAVETALAMVGELRRLNAEWAARGQPALDIGVGINTGDMVAGNIGSDTIMSYTVIGDNVNLASRLESLNKEYGSRIIISESTRSELKGRYDIRPLGSVRVKGKTQPVDIYEVRIEEEGAGQPSLA
jgi:adenylate cyclase